MRGMLAGAIMTAASLVAAPALAEGPMTPVRPLSSPPGATQWEEPPPASKSAPAGPAATSAPAASPAVAAAEPDTQPGQTPNAVEQRPSRRSAGGSGGSTASRLNRQELARIRSGSGASYYRGYSFWPFRF